MLKVTYRKTLELKRNPKNPRMHSDDHVAQIVGSIEEFGFTVPILLDGKSNVIDGHGRLDAALAMGEESVPTIDIGHLTKKQQREYLERLPVHYLYQFCTKSGAEKIRDMCTEILNRKGMTSIEELNSYTYL